MDKTVTITKHESYYDFAGPDYLLRQIIFHIGDLVWPTWFENAAGRKTYIQYADTGAKQGNMSVGRNMFLTEERFDAVVQRLRNDQVPCVFTVAEPEGFGQVASNDVFGSGGDCRPECDEHETGNV